MPSCPKLYFIIFQFSYSEPSLSKVIISKQYFYIPISFITLVVMLNRQSRFGPRKAIITVCLT
jgi:hypothetical protein